jgi:hypothetical protein
LDDAGNEIVALMAQPAAMSAALLTVESRFVWAFAVSDNQLIAAALALARQPNACTENGIAQSS